MNGILHVDLKYNSRMYIVYFPPQIYLPQISNMSFQQIQSLAIISCDFKTELVYCILIHTIMYENYELTYVSVAEHSLW